MAELHVLRVFCAEDGSGGNALGVFLGGADVSPDRRQGVARELGFAETVFVEGRERGELRIFTPEVELPLAGHPLVGTAWLLREQGLAVADLRPPAGTVQVRFERELVFVAGEPEWAPPFRWEQLGSPEQVDRLDGPPEDGGLVGMWAWIDEPSGLIRARVFAPEAGVTEDDATGSAAMRLVAELGRAIRIRQGPTAGSLILARLRDDGLAEVAGRAGLDEVREYAV